MVHGGDSLRTQPSGLLTGKYTIHYGVRRNDEDLPAEEVTIAEA